MANENVNIVIKAVDKTKRTFNAVTKGLNMVKKSVFSLKSGLLALGGAAGFGFLIKQSLNATDQLGKTADKIGIATDKLGALHHAATLTGVATGTLDMALQRMVRRVSEAALGTGEAVKALQELNIDAEKLNKLSPDEQFRAIAEAMQGVTNQSDKVRLAMRLFDSEGVALVNTLKDGSKGLDAMTAEAERLGLTMSKDTVKGVEAANDSISKLTGYIKGTFNRVVAAMAPYIQDVTDAIREWMELKISESGGIVAFSKMLIEDFKTVYNYVSAAGRAVRNFVSGMQEMERSLKLKEIDHTNKKIDELSIKLGSLYDEQERLSKGDLTIFENLVGAEDVTTQIDETIEKITNRQLKISELNQWFADNPLTITISNAGGGAAVLDEEETDSALAGVTALSESYKKLAESYKLMDEGQGIEEKRKAKEDEYREMLELTAAYYRKNAALQKLAKKDNVEMAKTAGMETLGVMATFNKKAFEMNKAVAIKEALISTFKAVGKAQEYGFPANIALTALALAQGYANVSSIRSTQYREKGGPISAGSPYIVGERGPELIVPNQAANVVPNDQLGGNNVTINITTNDASGFDDLLTRSRGTLLGLMNQALNENGRPALT